MGGFWVRPMVHAGFLRCYTAEGFRGRVLACLSRAIHAARDHDHEADVDVFITGHSLGGGLAMLCALDVANKMRDINIKCYTYGAPRVGNHVFAWIYAGLVPDTWHIVNNDVRRWWIEDGSNPG